MHYQPPSDIQMQYPAIVYRHSRSDTEFADNLPYRRVDGYQVTVIGYEPDHPVSAKIAKLPTCTFERSFSADHLHHDVYNLFY